jgi:hypothetical protein
MADDFKIKDDNIKNAIREVIAPYLKYDQSGTCIESYSSLGSDMYLGELEKTGRNLDENVSPELVNKASRGLLGINENDVMPEINGLPVIPFEQGMLTETMVRAWNSVTEEDLILMNGEQPPVDSVLVDAEVIPFSDLKGGWLVMVQPGKYNIAVLDEEKQAFHYAMRADSKLPYVFDYDSIAEDLRSRRATDGS